MGVGFVFSPDDPFVGVDLDHCRDPESGVVKPAAQEITTELNSYTEISPSGTGVHIIVQARLSRGGRRRTGNFECYGDSRYFTMTGDHLDGTPTTIEERQEQLNAVLARMLPAKPSGNANGRPKMTVPTTSSITNTEIIKAAMGAKNGAEFRRLWNGDTAGYPSHSEADLALCDRIAFYAGNDAGRIDQLFRQSGLMREKWERGGLSRPDHQHCDCSNKGNMVTGNVAATARQFKISRRRENPPPPKSVDPGPSRYRQRRPDSTAAR